MATEIQEHHEANLTELLTGILSDIQDLLKQQFQLFKAEVQRDLQRMKTVALLIVSGAGLAAIAALLFAQTLVYLLSWSVPALPLWACFGIVAGVMAAVGAVLIIAGVQWLRSFNPLPDQSARALVENVQCLTNPK